MARLVRMAVAGLLVLPPLAVCGCGSGKDEGKPNPDLQIPDVPAKGKDAGKGDMSSPKDKKK